MVTVSATRAISENTSPAIVDNVAAWHEHRAQVIGRVLKEGKNRAFGDKVSDRDLIRHQETATELREVAREMRSILLAGVDK